MYIFDGQESKHKFCVWLCVHACVCIIIQYIGLFQNVSIFVRMPELRLFMGHLLELAGTGYEGHFFQLTCY